jgi:hypothetical protein
LGYFLLIVLTWKVNLSGLFMTQTPHISPRLYDCREFSKKASSQETLKISYAKKFTKNKRLIMIQNALN